MQISPSTPAFPPRLQFPSAPVGAIKQVAASGKFSVLPAQHVTGSARIDANDGYRFAATVDMDTVGGGKVHMVATMTQIGADLVQYDWDGQIKLFGSDRLTIPLRFHDTFRIVSSSPDNLRLRNVHRPNDPDTVFTYVDGEESSRVVRKNFVVTTDNFRDDAAHAASLIGPRPVGAQPA